MADAPGSPLRGTAFKLLHIACVVVMLSLIKSLAELPLGEVMFFRCFFSIIPIAIWLIARGELRNAFRATRPLGHVSRTLIGLSAMGMTFVAVRELPLPEAITLQYSQPLFVVALSAIVIRETVGIFRWGAVTFGFLGVLVITWPSLTLFGSGADALSNGQILGVSAALSAAAAVAVSLLVVGQLVRTERPATIVIYFWMISSLVLALTAFAGWEPLTGEQIAILVVSGILGGFAQLFMAESLRWAPASATASLEYTSLLLALAIGYLAFGDIPHPNSLWGGAMVIVAGLVITWRERKRGIARRAGNPAAPPQ
jgi:drug/metabolite transporter (DMT)-like permease